ncbi:hypothetical protein YTPLAS18_40500 [Nitrospira sp.]|nr:hypothetical protein YTPLAS18_40500 [Nitrospira sp.]
MSMFAVCRPRDDPMPVGERVVLWRILGQLIVQGRRGSAEVPPALRPKGRRELIDRCLDWDALAEVLSVEELENLIRGLVLYSGASGWCRGSVSPVIALYWKFVRRAPRREPRLTGWIVRNRVNEYDPFGTIVHFGAMNLRDFETAWEWKKAIARQNIAAERERQEADRKRAAVRATGRLANAVRRGDIKAVAALLRRGADPVAALPGQSLVGFAEAQGRTSVAELLRQRGYR